MEVKKLVDTCYAEVKELLTSKKAEIEALAECLLEKESINLPEIMAILGERPYPLKDSVKEYLEELEKRKADEEEIKFDDSADKEADEEVDAAVKDDEPKEEEAKEETSESEKKSKDGEEEKVEKKDDDKKGGWW
jgi:hypothetical protein